MYRVKVFCGAADVHGIPILEREINAWLVAAKPVIRQMTQSGVGAQVVVTFLYEQRRQEDEAHLTTAEVPDAFERELEDTALDPAEDQPPTLPEAELPY